MIQTVGVIGAGTMGNGIAQAFACAGKSVVLQDIQAAALERALKTIEGSLDRLIKKGSLTEPQRSDALARISSHTELSALAGVDLIVEAATENERIKLEILKAVEQQVDEACILATNTSSLSITALAAQLKRPGLCIGMHFFNPVPLMPLVEIIRGLKTQPEVIETIQALAVEIGKTPILVKNSAGFVVNRLLCPMINEAVFVLAEGLATAQEIDDGMKLGCNHPIGPLALADLVGLDVLLAVMNVLSDHFEDPKYRPAPLLKEMVAAGQLGRKSGQGFYSYHSA